MEKYWFNFLTVFEFKLSIYDKNHSDLDLRRIFANYCKKERGLT
jgi:hypothetical protein